MEPESHLLELCGRDCSITMMPWTYSASSVTTVWLLTTIDNMEVLFAGHPVVGAVV